MAEYATKQDFQEALAGLETRLLERIEKSETTLLKEFRKWPSASKPLCALTRFSSPASTSASPRLKTAWTRSSGATGSGFFTETRGLRSREVTAWES